MANEIIANPAELRKYASGINKCHAAYRSHLQGAKGQVDSLKGVWTGDAASTFNASFTQLLNKCYEGLDTLARMVNALYESADTYERSEKAVQNEASKLPKLPNNTMR